MGYYSGQLHTFAFASDAFTLDTTPKRICVTSGDQVMDLFLVRQMCKPLYYEAANKNKESLTFNF